MIARPFILPGQAIDASKAAAARAAPPPPPPPPPQGATSRAATPPGEGANTKALGSRICSFDELKADGIHGCSDVFIAFDKFLADGLDVAHYYGLMHKTRCVSVSVGISTRPHRVAACRQICRLDLVLVEHSS